MGVWSGRSGVKVVVGTRAVFGMKRVKSRGRKLKMKFRSGEGIGGRRKTWIDVRVKCRLV